MSAAQNSPQHSGQESGQDSGHASGNPAPYFEIVGGNPTAEQVGILSAVFALAEGNAAIAARNPSPGIRNDWGRPAEKARGVFWNSTSSFLDPKHL